MLQSLRFRYLISFIVVGLIATLLATYIGYFLTAQANADANVINLSGRQRMLSQRISKVAAQMRYETSPVVLEELSTEMKDSLKLWSASHYQLYQGQLSSYSGARNSPEVVALFEELHPLFLEMAAAASTITEETSLLSNPHPEELETILDTNIDFVTIMDVIVNQYDAEATQRSNRISVASYVAGSIIILALIFLWFFLVKPSLKEAENIDKAKSEFVSLASHQLRTPLTAINWYTEMLANGDAGKMNAQQKEFAESVHKSSIRMVDLVNALLNVSRIDLGTFSINPEPVDVKRLVRDVADELKPQIDTKHQTLKLDLPKSDITLMADEKLLRMVFQNLLANATKYTPEKGLLSLTLKVVGDQLTFDVKDSGIGIPKNQQSKIFTKLFRAKNAEESEAEGTGLGLYIVKSVIENAGGDISFESEENKGTTFHVSMPLEGMKKREGNKALT